MRQVTYCNHTYYYHGKGMVKEKTNTGKEVSVTKAILEDSETGKMTYAEIDELTFLEKPNE